MNQSKWQKSEEELNDSVLILEENLPPTQWQVGTVIDLHLGEDGLTRVVSLRVGDAVMKRPITKSCPFPKEETIAKSTNLARVSCRKRNHFNVLPIIVALLTFSTTLCYPRSILNNSEKPFQILSFEKPPDL